MVGYTHALVHNPSPGHKTCTPYRSANGTVPNWPHGFPLGCHMGGLGAVGAGAHGEPRCGGAGAPITGPPTGPGAPIGTGEPIGGPMVPGAPNEPGPIPGGAPIDPGPGGPGAWGNIPGALPHETVVFRLEMGVTTSSSSAARAFDPSGCRSGEGVRLVPDVPIGRAMARLGMSPTDPREGISPTEPRLGISPTGTLVGKSVIDPRRGGNPLWNAAPTPKSGGVAGNMRIGGGGGVNAIPG